MMRRPASLLDLPAELLVAVATQLAEDDELAASLACRKLREAVAGTERHRAGAQLSTSIGSAFGSVGKLAWAASCGLPLSAKLLTHAARLGQLEHLRWLRAHGCAWEPCTLFKGGPCSSAAEGGHLSVLQWARGNGCPWNRHTCASAARGGHLAVVQWARANGCPWDADTGFPVPSSPSAFPMFRYCRVPVSRQMTSPGRFFKATNGSSLTSGKCCYHGSACTEHATLAAHLWTLEPFYGVSVTF
jgi:hypothetical protein